MTDCFALLGEPRRPWLDPDCLKQKFLRLSAEVHPDRFHSAGPDERRLAQQRYAELNSAYQTLREHKPRLQHLLELELGHKPSQIQNILPELMDLSAEVGRLCQQTDAFLAQKRQAGSSLLEVQLFERGQAWGEQLRVLQEKIQSRHEQLVAQLKATDASWQANRKVESTSRTATLQRLEELYRLFAYFARWNAQIQERLVQLSF